MAGEATQQVEFVTRVLPSLFHSSPREFLDLLERDGNRFLRFYWNEAGKKVGAEQQETAFGLQYQIRRPRRQVTVAIIILPPPQHPGEAYFTALCYRPYRVTPILRIQDTTKVLVLEHALDQNQQVVPQLVEWTRRLEREKIEPLPQPALEDFYRAVLEQIKE